ncbi:MAG: NADH-quinone oxidoreductase subunit NuoK [Candidatus Thermoplasmatota archaeon]|jgi:NADH-quinone oxidoreductase subunit K|nr:NADH-quinone oxidoreductase subunit NuoK [Candidatus Thermoplasmatota archaeon]
MLLAIPETVSLILFCVGLYGVMTSKVGIKMLISLEIMINSAVLNLISVAGASSDPLVLALFVIAIAAVESVVGFSLLVAIYRKFGKVDIPLLSEIKG